MVSQVLNATDHCVVDFNFLCLNFLDYWAVAEWDTEFIGLKGDVSDDLVLFGIIKSKLCFPVLIVIYNWFVTLIDSNEILKDHKFSTTVFERDFLAVKIVS